MFGVPLPTVAVCGFSVPLAAVGLLEGGRCDLVGGVWGRCECIRTCLPIWILLILNWILYLFHPCCGLRGLGIVFAAWGWWCGLPRTDRPLPPPTVQGDTGGGSFNWFTAVLLCVPRWCLKWY